MKTFRLPTKKIPHLPKIQEMSWASKFPTTKPSALLKIFPPAYIPHPLRPGKMMSNFLNSFASTEEWSFPHSPFNKGRRASGAAREGA